VSRAVVSVARTNSATTVQMTVQRVILNILVHREFKRMCSTRISTSPGILQSCRQFEDPGSVTQQEGAGRTAPSAGTAHVPRSTCQRTVRRTRVVWS
jgi:hypothetical protein